MDNNGRCQETSLKILGILHLSNFSKRIKSGRRSIDSGGNKLTDAYREVADSLQKFYFYGAF